VRHLAVFPLGWITWFELVGGGVGEVGDVVGEPGLVVGEPPPPPVEVTSIGVPVSH
jgi:hypothetical protein